MLKMSTQSKSLDTRTLLQNSLGICEKLFEESSLNSAPFTILDIEKLAERSVEELKKFGKTRVKTGPFTMNVSKDSDNYKVRLNIPDFIPKGLVFDRLSELRETVYREFERQGICYIK